MEHESKLQLHPDSRWPPLSNDRSIRILSLSAPPISGGRALRCRLQTVSLRERYTTTYSAVSWVWGRYRETELLYCNDCKVLIKASLESALRQIWMKRPTETLWIDTLCINQDDLDEKSAQVTMMGKIYETAARVFVWLGNESSESVQAFELLNQALTPSGRSLSVIGRGRDFPTTARQSEDSKDSLSSSDDAETYEEDIMRDIRNLAKPLRHLLRTAWFTRIWTLQEVILAREAWVLCGSSAMLWSDFIHACKRLMRGVHWIRHEEVIGLNLDGISKCDQTYQGSLPSQYRTLSTFLLLTRNRYATDKRDRIYAVLGLIPDIARTMSIDYTRSVEDVFTMASQKIIESEMNLEILEMAGLANRGLQDTSPTLSGTWDQSGEEISQNEAIDHLLPSWVPNWNNVVVLSQPAYNRRVSIDMMLQRSKPRPPQQPPPRMKFSFPGSLLGSRMTCRQLHVRGAVVALACSDELDFQQLPYCCSHPRRKWLSIDMGNFARKPWTVNQLATGTRKHASGDCGCRKEGCTAKVASLESNRKKENDKLRSLAAKGDWLCIIYGHHKVLLLRPHESNCRDGKEFKRSAAEHSTAAVLLGSFWTDIGVHQAIDEATQGKGKDGSPWTDFRYCVVNLVLE